MDLMRPNVPNVSIHLEMVRCVVVVATTAVVAVVVGVVVVVALSFVTRIHE